MDNILDWAFLVGMAMIMLSAAAFFSACAVSAWKDVFRGR